MQKIKFDKVNIFMALGMKQISFEPYFVNKNNMNTVVIKNKLIKI